MTAPPDHIDNRPSPRDEALPGARFWPGPLRIVAVALSVLVPLALGLLYAAGHNLLPGLRTAIMQLLDGG